MKRMAEFSKVSYNQFHDDWLDTFDALKDETDNDKLEKHLRNIYNGIKLPKRATAQSAAYDFFSPMSFVLEPNDSITIPTGVCCEMYDGWALMIHPRSGLGFKYGLGLANHTAIIDGDYIDSDNGGHIFIKLTNCSCLAKELRINKGSGFAQGMFVPFGITLDDNTTAVRNGGLGSTDNAK